MILQSTDKLRTLDVGSGDISNSILSTLNIRLSHLLSQVPLAIGFLGTGSCVADAAQETARQLNLIRDALAQVPPELAVFDQNDLAKQAPWTDNLSPIVTSCANLYLTSDGRDFLVELVKILAYASVIGVDIVAIS